MNAPDTEWREVEKTAQQIMDNPQFQSSDPVTVLSLLVSTLSSRDTYWKERVFVEIEQFKSEVATLDYGEDFKDGIYATIEHILAMPLFESVLNQSDI